MREAIKTEGTWSLGARAGDSVSVDVRRLFDDDSFEIDRVFDDPKRP